MNYATANLMLCACVVIILILYVIFVYICYTQKVLMYSPYVQQPAPENAYYPQGNITTLTQQQINTRNALIEEALSS